MNVCVAHLQMNACVAKNFGAWTEKVGHPCPTFMAHPTRVGRRVGALHKKLGHPWVRMNSFIRMLDALKASLRRAIVYSDIAEMFLFLANLKATKLEIGRGVKLLEAYPDVDPKLTDELLHFHLYVRQRQCQELTEE